MTQMTSNNPQFRIVRHCYLDGKDKFSLQKRGWFFWRNFNDMSFFNCLATRPAKLFDTEKECEKQAEQWMAWQEAKRKTKVVKHFDVGVV